MIWKILLGIVLFIVVLLSIRIKVTVHSESKMGIDWNGAVLGKENDNIFELYVGWLFLKFRLLPKKENKKPKKPKKEKKPEEETEIIPEPKEKKKKSKDNIFLRFYRNNGVGGVLELLSNLKSDLGGMFKQIGRAFLFEQMYIFLQVGAGDSADTALKYGKVCSAAYPAMGFFVANMRVKKSNLQVQPDFLYGSNLAKVHAKISVRPIRLINAFIVVGVKLVFNVLLKFLKGSKAAKPEAQKEEI